MESVGAVAERVHGPATAVADVTRAVRRAVVERRAVVLMLPLDVQAADGRAHRAASAWPELAPVRPGVASTPSPEVLARAERPAIIGGRGAVLSGAGPALRRLGELTGAVLATSAVANGLFAGDPFAVGISGGFALADRRSACSAEADVDRRLRRLAEHVDDPPRRARVAGATVVQVDRDEEAIGAHRPVDIGVVGDARETAEALVAALAGTAGRRPRRRAAPQRRARGRDRRRRVARRALRAVARLARPAHALDRARRPAARRADRGRRLRRVHGLPVDVPARPGRAGFVFPQAFQCVGLALGNAIGAAVARPDRLTVAAVGDGGLLMALPELETLGRVKPDMLVVVYDDAAYGAEVHHFRPMGIPVELAQFPPTDFAALAEAAGCRGLTARTLADLEGVREWLGEPRPPARAGRQSRPRHLCRMARGGISWPLTRPSRRWRSRSPTAPCASST